MEKSTIDHRVAFPANHQATIVAQPSKQSFDLPSLAVASQFAAILRCGLSATFPMRTDQLDSHLGQAFPQKITVVSAVGNQPIRFAVGLRRRSDLAQRGFGQGHFVRGSRVNVVSHRKTRAVCHHHKLCALPPLGFPDRTAPFFAGAKVPSIKDSDHSSWPCSSSWAMKVRQIFSQVPSSSHCLSRRQQVEALGYSRGSAFQGAPVQRIHKIPSRHWRSGIAGRPPFDERFRFGNNGLIRLHCSSVNSFMVAPLHLILIQGLPRKTHKSSLTNIFKPEFGF
jgi:hypothetical protein